MFFDLARIEQLLEQTEIDRTLLDDILRRYNLQLPAAPFTREHFGVAWRRRAQAMNNTMRR